MATFSSVLKGSLFKLRPAYIYASLTVFSGILFVDLIVGGALAKTPENSPMLNSPVSNQLFVEPFKQIEHMQKQMDALFKESFRNLKDFSQMPFDKPNQNMLSDMKVINNKKNYIVKIKVPNQKNGDFDINIAGRQLSISGKVSKDLEFKKGESKIQYQSYFLRSITLPLDVDLNTMKTDFKTGVLTITFKKKKHISGASPINMNIDDVSVDNSMGI